MRNSIIASCCLVFSLSHSSRAQEVAAPAPAEAIRAGYVIGPEDQIVIRAFEAEEISDKPIQVGVDGFITLPMLGRVHAEGLTVEQLEKQLCDRLKTYVREPQVAVSVTEFRSHPISVLGSVNTPGIQQIRGDKTLIEVLSAAGGVRADAGSSIRIVRQSRWGSLPLPNAAKSPGSDFSTGEVSLRNVMDAKKPEENILIRPNDIITVPRADLVYVIGEVNKAGGFVLNDKENISVLQALALAGGMMNTAAGKRAKVLRVTPGSPQRTELAVNVGKIVDGEAPDVPLSPDDILFVPRNVPRSVSLRIIESAVNIGTGIAIWHH